LDPKTLFSVSFDTSYRYELCNGGTLNVYCNVSGGGAVLSFQPTSTWQTITTSSLCQTDDSGKATIKFIIGQTLGNDCTVFIDNIAITGITMNFTSLINTNSKPSSYSNYIISN